MERTALIAELEAHAEYLEMVLVLDVAPELEIELRDVRAFLTQLQAQPIETAPVAPSAPQRKPSAPRCCFHKAIRRCFAIAKDAGLDTRADEAMRESFARYLCCDVPSRESLSGGDWLLLGNAIKSKRLAW